MVHFQTTTTVANKKIGEIDVAQSVVNDLDWCFIDPSLLSKPAVETSNAVISAPVSPKSITKHPYLPLPTSASPPTSASLSTPTSASTSAFGATPPAPSSTSMALLQTPPPPPLPPHPFSTSRNNKRQRQQEQAQKITNDKKQKTPGYKKVDIPTAPHPLRRPGPSLNGLRAANQTLSGFVGAKYSGDINNRSGGISVKTTADNIHQAYFSVFNPAKAVQRHHHHCLCHHSCPRDVSPPATVTAQEEIANLKTKVEKLEKMLHELSARVDFSQAQPASVV